MVATKRLKSFDQSWIGLLIAYIVLDLLFVAGGMGVPIFCIIFGLAIGWFTAMRARVFRADLRAAMRLNVRYAAIASLVTFALMAVIWGRMLPLLQEEYWLQHARRTSRTDCGRHP